MSRKLGCDYLEFSYIYKTLLKWNLLSVGSKSNIVDNFIKLVRKWGGKGNAWKVHIWNFLHKRSNKTECLPFHGFQANSSLKFRIRDQGFGFFRFHELCLQTFSWNRFIYVGISWNVNPGNALARMQRVHQPADLWEINFCPHKFWGF